MFKPWIERSFALVARPSPAEPVRGVPRLALAAGVRRLRDALRAARARAAPPARCPCRPAVRAVRRVHPAPAAASTPAWRRATTLRRGPADRAVQVPAATRTGPRRCATLAAQCALGRAGRRAAPTWCCRCRWRRRGCASAATTRPGSWRAGWRRARSMPTLLLRTRETPRQIGLPRARARCATCAAPSRSSRCARRAVQRPAHRAGRRRDDDRRHRCRGRAGCCARPARRASTAGCWRAPPAGLTAECGTPCSTSSWSNPRSRPTPAT